MCKRRAGSQSDIAGGLTMWSAGKLLMHDVNVAAEVGLWMKFNENIVCIL